MPWLSVATSSSLSESSWAAVAVTVCGAPQFEVVNVRLAGDTATSALSLEMETPTPPVQPVGTASSATV